MPNLKRKSKLFATQSGRSRDPNLGRDPLFADWCSTQCCRIYWLCEPSFCRKKQYTYNCSAYCSLTRRFKTQFYEPAACVSRLLCQWAT